MSGLVMRSLPIPTVRYNWLQIEATYIYISLAGTVSKMSVELIMKCKHELTVKMGDTS